MTKIILEAITLKLLFIPLFFKLFIIFFAFRNIKDFAVYQAFAHDSIIIFLILLITYLSYFFKKKFFSFSLRILALTIYTFYIFDLIIWTSFATHITINDMLKFIDYIPTFIEQKINFNFPIIVCAIFLILLSVRFIINKHEIKNKFTHILFLPILSSLLFINLSADNKFYMHSWIYKNFIEYNIEIQSQTKQYSQEFANKALDYKENFNCIENKRDVRNVIILMVESLASYQSKLFSGLNDWTPNIDKIAKRSIYFSDFHANGFITEHAEISLLTGDIPIVQPQLFNKKSSSTSFNPFYNIEYSIPFLLKNKNIHSEFITSSDLKFSNTGNWAKSIGFDYIEGSENIYYNELPKFHFGAPEDKYLYDRVLSRIKKNKNKEFFLFIKTVSSHVPFINPKTLNRSEEETIKYVDKEIGNFYKKLEQNDFFKNNGMLIIVGDHHPTAPVKDIEIDKFGQYKASSFVPAIISFNNKKAKIEDQFQQIDIYNTVLSHFGNNICTSNWIGNFNNSENYKSPKYVTHLRPDHRSYLSVFKNEQIFNIYLNGDNTDIINSNNITENEKTQILSKINFDRIEDRTKYSINLGLENSKSYFPRSILK